jgi:DNA replication protein DnaC
LTTKEPKDPTHIAKAVADTLADLAPLIGSVPPAEWAERERRAQLAEQQRIAREQEEERRKAIERMLAAGFPRRAVEAAANPDLCEAVLQVRSWGAGERRRKSVLVLSGPTGCGKTVAAAVWAMEAHRGRCSFMRAASFAALSRYKTERRALLSHDALVLDDLGAEYADAAGNLQADLGELIDTYYGDMRPLVITTNLNATEFKARYDDRIVSRLREAGNWFELVGADQRGGSK